jgi:hypothetical protein
MNEMLKGNLKSTVSVSSMNFPVFEAQEVEDFSFFTEEELSVIKQKIQQYKENPRGLSGGGQILKELKYLEGYKEGLLEKVGLVRELIQPKERKKRETVNVAQILETEHEKMVRSVAYGFKILPEKVLRDVARTQIGDVEENYTRDELPLVLATKQIMGRLLDPEE